MRVVSPVDVLEWKMQILAASSMRTSNRQLDPIAQSNNSNRT